MIIFRIQPRTIVVVIEQNNMDRMVKSDPITLETQALGGFLPSVMQPDQLQIVIAYEPASEALYEVMRTDDMDAVWKYLYRGYEYTEVDGKVTRIPSTNRVQ